MVKMFCCGHLPYGKGVHPHPFLFCSLFHDSKGSIIPMGIVQLPFFFFKFSSKKSRVFHGTCISFYWNFLHFDLSEQVEMHCPLAVWVVVSQMLPLCQAWDWRCSFCHWGAGALLSYHGRSDTFFSVSISLGANHDIFTSLLQNIRKTIIGCSEHGRTNAFILSTTSETFLN